jgi:hypothetical protein
MELLNCPFCGEVPTGFDTISNGKWGFVQCCISGPEVRASYAPLEEWRERAIAEWNDRKAPAPSAEPVAVFDGYMDGGTAIIQWRDKGLPAGTLLYAAPVAAPAQTAPDLSKCPKCGGPADNGHDRCYPPNPYFCSKCSD